jgi:hypothetical protein
VECCDIFTAGWYSVLHRLLGCGTNLELQRDQAWTDLSVLHAAATMLHLRIAALEFYADGSHVTHYLHPPPHHPLETMADVMVAVFYGKKDPLRGDHYSPALLDETAGVAMPSLLLSGQQLLWSLVTDVGRLPSLDAVRSLLCSCCLLFFDCC